MDKKDFINVDIQRWQSLDFVVGYEIHLSNNPDHKCGVCCLLVGKYPKSFKWSGWHDKCKCFVVPILQDPEEFGKQELYELKAALKGSECKKKESENIIKILPKNFLIWYMQNVKEMLDTNNFPDFIIGNIDLIKESINHYRRFLL